MLATRHTCPLALVDQSQIVLPLVNHRDISQWDERGQAWRVCSPQVWRRSTFQIVHTCQILWYSAAPRETFVDHWLSPQLRPGAHAEGKWTGSSFSLHQIELLTMRIFISHSHRAITSEVFGISGRALGKTVFADSCIALFTVICGGQLACRCRQWHVHPQPSSLGGWCCACGDHKALTRMCVKCNIMWCFYLVWGAYSLVLIYYDFLCASSTVCNCVFLLCYPSLVHSLESQGNSEFAHWRGWETWACDVYGLEERSSLSCDYL